ncbi:hypothetical protein BDW72DRAFT_95244 [Aspergillus terricola var. indicus]
MLHTACFSLFPFLTSLIISEFIYTGSTPGWIYGALIQDLRLRHDIGLFFWIIYNGVPLEGDRLPLFDVRIWSHVGRSCWVVYTGTSHWERMSLLHDLDLTFEF